MKKNYLIVDFGASQMHTHHGMLILGYCDLINSMDLSVDIFLPLGSEIELNSVNCRTFYRLLPSYNPVGVRRNPSSWLPGLMGKIFELSKNTFMHKKISNALSWITVKLAVREILPFISNNSSSTIIFPTACPIAFRFGLELEKRKLKVNLIYRLTNTAERRGFHTKFFDLKQNFDSFNKARHVQTKFCYEMKEYGETLNGLNQDLYYSPAPPNSRIKISRSPREELYFGFLGMAQKQKGVVFLKDIVEGVSNLIGKKRVCWIIQTTKIPPRELEELSNSSHVSLLHGKISEADMNSALSRVDLICLPYVVETYKLNASALAYRAADNLALVATLRGSAFAREVSENGIGIVENTVEDLINSINDFDFTDLSYLENLSIYNKMRIDSNMKIIS